MDIRHIAGLILAALAPNFPLEGRESERWHQERLALEFKGRTEVKVENGRVDPDEPEARGDIDRGEKEGLSGGDQAEIGLGPCWCGNCSLGEAGLNSERNRCEL